MKQGFNKMDLNAENLESFFSEEEIAKAQKEMEAVDELVQQIMVDCMSWTERNGEENGHWPSNLLMGLSKSTAYLLCIIGRKADADNKESIVDYYQSMLSSCIEIAKKDIEQVKNQLS